MWLNKKQEPYKSDPTLLTNISDKHVQCMLQAAIDTGFVLTTKPAQWPNGLLMIGYTAIITHTYGNHSRLWKRYNELKELKNV